MPNYGSFDHGYVYEPQQTQPMAQAMYPSMVQNPATQAMQNYFAPATPSLNVMNPAIARLQRQQEQLGANARGANQWGTIGAHALTTAIGFAGPIGAGIAMGAEFLGIPDKIGGAVQGIYNWATDADQRQAQIQRQLQREQSIMGLQQFSQRFVTGGQFSNALTGNQGWNLQSSRQFYGAMERIQQRNPMFDTGEIFQMGIQNNMLRGQDPTQLARQLEGTIKSLKTFMLVAKNPDFRDAMQAMAELSQTGMNMSTANMSNILPQIQGYAQAARMTTSQMIGIGAQGAAVFNQMRIPGQFGVMGAMRNAATAQITAGNLPQWQLNMMGGAQGINESLMTGMARGQAHLSQLLPAFVNFEGDTPTVNTEMLRRYREGLYSAKDLQQMQKANLGTGKTRMIRQQLMEQYMPQLMGAVQEQMTPDDQMMMIERMADTMMQKGKGRITRHTAYSQILGGRNAADAYLASQSLETRVKQAQMSRAALINQERTERFQRMTQGIDPTTTWGRMITRSARASIASSMTGTDLRNIGGTGLQTLKKAIGGVLTGPTSTQSEYNLYRPVDKPWEQWDRAENVHPLEKATREWMGHEFMPAPEEKPILTGPEQFWEDVTGSLTFYGVGGNFWGSDPNLGRGQKRTSYTAGQRASIAFQRQSRKKQIQDIQSAGKDIRYFNQARREGQAYGRAGTEVRFRAYQNIQKGLTDVMSNSEVNELSRTLTLKLKKEARSAGSQGGGWLSGGGMRKQVNARKVMGETYQWIRERFGDRAPKIIEQLSKGANEASLMGLAYDRVKRTGTDEEKKGLAQSEEFAAKYDDALGTADLKSEVTAAEDTLKEALGDRLSGTALTETAEMLREFGIESEGDIAMLQEALGGGSEVLGQITELAQEGKGEMGKRARNVERFMAEMALKDEGARKDIQNVLAGTQEVTGEGIVGMFQGSVQESKRKSTAYQKQIRGALSTVVTKQPEAQAQKAVYGGLAQILGTDIETVQARARAGGGLMKYLEAEATSDTSYARRMMTGELGGYVTKIRKAKELEEKSPEEAAKLRAEARSNLEDKLLTKMKSISGKKYVATSAKGKGAPVDSEVFGKVAETMGSASDKMDSAADKILQASTQGVFGFFGSKDEGNS